jgi:hypothetical protein
MHAVDAIGEAASTYLHIYQQLQIKFGLREKSTLHVTSQLVLYDAVNRD